MPVGLSWWLPHQGWPDGVREPLIFDVVHDEERENQRTRFIHIIEEMEAELENLKARMRKAGVLKEKGGARREEADGEEGDGAGAGEEGA